MCEPTINIKLCRSSEPETRNLNSRYSGIGAVQFAQNVMRHGDDRHSIFINLLILYIYIVS